MTSSPARGLAMVLLLVVAGAPALAAQSALRCKRPFRSTCLQTLLDCFDPVGSCASDGFDITTWSNGARIDRQFDIGEQTSRTLYIDSRGVLCATRVDTYSVSSHEDFATYSRDGQTWIVHIRRRRPWKLQVQCPNGDTETHKIKADPYFYNPAEARCTAFYFGNGRYCCQACFYLPQ